MRRIIVETNTNSQHFLTHSTCMCPSSRTLLTITITITDLSRHRDPSLCPFAEDIACWVPELGQVESPTLYAATPVVGK